MLTRVYEHFEKARPVPFHENVASIPPMLYSQGRDWTCSVACLRSIASKYIIMEDEDSIVEHCGMNHGPYYAHELEACGLLTRFDYEMSSKKPDVWSELLRIYALLQSGATIMVETCRSFDHWLVLLAYFTNNCRYTEDQHVLLWDPYYNETILVRTSEFCDEWVSGDWAKNGIVCDFIAIKGVK